MQYQNILTEERDGVFIVTLNRPQARNAINSAIWAELCDAFSGFEQNPGLKVAIITNNGPAFCAVPTSRPSPRDGMRTLPRALRTGGSRGSPSTTSRSR